MQEKPVCLSGGAKGADLAWGDAATAAGHDVLHFVFAGHRSTAPREQLHFLSREELELAEPHLVKANKRLRRKWPVRNDFVANLLRRNFFQVRHSDSLYAVSHLDRDGMVAGGTSWACAMMIDLHPEAPIFLFDQKVSQWYRWKGAWMPCLQPPVPTGVYAGVGSRDLLPSGEKAIVDVFGS